MLKVCKICGKAFESKRGDAVYCSPQCQYDGQKKRKNEYYRRKYGQDQQAPPPRFCDICGVEIPKDSPRKKYCSEECAYKGMLKRSEKCNQIKRAEEAKAKTNKRKTIPPLDKILKDLNQYNKKHGTHLSYGQYVQMIEKGE